MRQKPKILIVGSGIVGASIALSCINLGAEVVVLEQDKLGGAASSKSFGWINASFAESPAYFELRNAAVEAFRNLKSEVDLNDSVRWQGTLWWEDSGAELNKQFNDLVGRGYAAKLLNIKDIKKVEIESLENSMLKNFYKDSKKVNNQKMKEFFNYRLKFPTYVEGLNYIRDNFIKL